MGTSLWLLAAVVVLARPASAQTTGLHDPLLDRLIGDWVLQGTIADDRVTHDVVFAWVLGQHYVRFHEVAREKDPSGGPAYEAIVFIGWDEPSERYACLWLDSTGGGGLSSQAIGYGEAGGDSIPFIFRLPDGSGIHTTFAYNRSTDTWQWHIDNERNGRLTPFARVTLSKKGGQQSLPPPCFSASPANTRGIHPFGKAVPHRPISSGRIPASTRHGTVGTVPSLLFHVAPGLVSIGSTHRYNQKRC